MECGRSEDLIFSFSVRNNYPQQITIQQQFIHLVPAGDIRRSRNLRGFLLLYEYIKDFIHSFIRNKYSIPCFLNVRWKLFKRLVPCAPCQGKSKLNRVFLRLLQKLCAVCPSVLNVFGRGKNRFIVQLLRVPVLTSAMAGGFRLLELCLNQRQLPLELQNIDSSGAFDSPSKRTAPTMRIERIAEKYYALQVVSSCFICPSFDCLGWWYWTKSWVTDFRRYEDYKGS